MWAGYRNQLARWRMLGLGMNPSGALPTEVAGLQLWIDFSDPSTLFTDTAKTDPANIDGDVIGAAEDKSGNGNDVVQATAIKKPTLQLNELNGLSVGRGDGGDDILQSLATGAIAQPTTCFIVVQTPDATPALFGLWFDGVGARNVIGVNSGTNGYYMFANVVLNGDALDTNFHILTAIYNGVSSLFYKDGVVMASGNAGGANLDGFSLFSSFDEGNPILGDIAQAIYYDTQLSSVDLNLIGNYLGSRFALPWTNI